MSLQRIINGSTELSIDRRRIIGIQMTRNEIPKISSLPTRNPWRLTVTPHEGFLYNEVRSLLETIDNMDREVPEEVTFSNNPSMNWMFRYQGSLYDIDRANIQVGTFSGTRLTLINVPQLTQYTTDPYGVNNLNYYFKKGDLVQIQGHPYPFSITADYDYSTVSSSGILQVVVHRPNFISGNVQNSFLNYGADCRWKVLCKNMPTYSISPGGATYDVYGQLINNGIVKFNEAFELVEDTSST